MKIDRDNFDEVLAKVAPKLDLALGDGGPRVSVSFASMDDFHPDSLCRRLPLLAALHDERVQFGNPETFRAAAAEFGGAQERRAVSDPPAGAGGNLLDRMVENTPGAAEVRPPFRGDLREFIDRALAGHVVPGKDARQEEFVARADATLSVQMRMLLGHPDFRELEANWRGLFFLARRLETGVDLSIHLIDVSKEELRADLIGAANLRETDFYRYAVQPGGAVEPWAALAGLYSFGPTLDDVELLARIGMIAAQSCAPFLAGALPAVVGCPAFSGMPDPREWSVESTAAGLWQELRRLPEAASIGLLAPRFLLRLPYGAATTPIDEFPFEEIDGEPSHDDYVWGGAALAGVCLLAQAFSADGWRLRPGSLREISGLPLHVYRSGGESVAQPCAEAWLTDRAVEGVLDCGVMPLAAARNSDRLLLARFQSLADPPAPLAGRW